MNGAFEVGAAALRAEQAALEVLANNVANVNTPAFKRSDIRFAEVLANQVAAGGTPDQIAPADGPQSGGVRVLAQPEIFAQGEVRQTGNPLDIAIEGRGFIELMGPTGQMLLWRGGRLQVNEEGYLATADGVPLRAGIMPPADTTGLAIARNGLVTVLTGTGEQVELGQIALVRPDHEGALDRLDSGLYRAGPDTMLIDAQPGEDGAGEILQGSTEASNVELTAEMVQLLVVQRAYGANAQVIQTADQIAAITNNLKE